MPQPTKLMEDRAFELFGELGIKGGAIATILAREFAISEDEGFDVAKKVLYERGTPRTARVKEAIAELEKIRF